MFHARQATNVHDVSMKHVCQIKRGQQKQVWKLQMVKQTSVISSYETSRTAIDEEISACKNTFAHATFTYHSSPLTRPSYCRGFYILCKSSMNSCAVVCLHTPHQAALLMLAAIPQLR